MEAVEAFEQVPSIHLLIVWRRKQTTFFWITPTGLLSLQTQKVDQLFQEDAELTLPTLRVFVLR